MTPFSNELSLLPTITLFFSPSLFVLSFAARRSVIYLTFHYLCRSIQHVFDNSALLGDNSWGLLIHRWHHRFVEFIVLHLLGVALPDHDVPSGFLIHNILILKKEKKESLSVNWAMLCSWHFIFFLNFFLFFCLNVNNRAVFVTWQMAQSTGVLLPCYSQV